MRLEMYGLDRLLFVPLGVVKPRHGPDIHVWSPLSLTEDEYKSVSKKGSFDPKNYDQRVRDRWLADRFARSIEIVSAICALYA